MKIGPVSSVYVKYFTVSGVDLKITVLMKVGCQAFFALTVHCQVLDEKLWQHRVSE